MRARVLTCLLIAAALFSCRQEKDKPFMDGERIMVAEDIIYDVIIKIPDTGDPWEVERLEGYSGDRMISELFNAVYTEKITAYDYHSGRKLSASDVRKAEMQTGFERNNIGKIQFTENWYYNTASMDIEKEIISLVLGYENRDIDGTLIGYEAVFKLEFK
ncbi:MAG: hypothetical protein KFF49_11575 [Bacteroidales bacterium]|nr:hypothetical protein [Bacteroidales bacterium]